MGNYVLRADEELVIQDHIRLSILGVEEDEVILGITAEPNHERGAETLQWRIRQMAASASLVHDN